MEKLREEEEEGKGERDGDRPGLMLCAPISLVPNLKYIYFLHLFPLTSHCVF